MIIVQLLGGLGNQMFQYALGRRLSLQNSVPLLLDCRLLNDRTPGRHAVQRQYALDIFQISAPQASLKDTIVYSAWGMPRPLRAVARLFRISSESRQTHEIRFGYDESVLSIQGRTYLSGLWQSGRYLEGIEETLRRDFRFAVPLDYPAGILRDKIVDCHSVCLHVRRTDYLSNPTSAGSLNIAGLDYYRTGVDRILAENSSARFFVFSDDIPWCRENLTFVPNVDFVPNELAGMKDAAHLELMSMCQSFLIPNSTFSWWAAWLSRHPEKQVFLPDTWFPDESMDASGFYLDGWQRLPVAATVGNSL